MPQTPIVERAFALARSGECDGVNDIRSRLAREGYESLAAWFESRSFKTALTLSCRRAKGAPAGPSPSPIG